MTLRILSN